MLQGKLPSARTTDRRDNDVGRAAHLVKCGFKVLEVRVLRSSPNFAGGFERCGSEY